MPGVTQSCLAAHDRTASPSVSDEELKRIVERAEHYAFTREHAMRHGSMRTTRAASLATVDVVEGASRELRRSKKGSVRRGGSASSPPSSARGS